MKRQTRRQFQWQLVSLSRRRALWKRRSNLSRSLKQTRRWKYQNDKAIKMTRRVLAILEKKEGSVTWERHRLVQQS